MQTSFNVLWLQPGRFSEFGDGTQGVMLLQIGEPKVVVGFGIGRSQLKGLVELLDGLVGLAQ